MAGAARLGDSDSGGSAVASGVVSSVRINGRPAAVVGSQNTPHPGFDDDVHPPSSICGGSGSVRIGGSPAARNGDPYDCGHSLSSGSSDVNIA